MQTLKLIIPGSYYDSQIYSGHLYLWTVEGSIITLDWSKLLEVINVPDELHLVANCAFQESNYLYSKAVRPFIQNKKIVEIIKEEFNTLAEYPIKLSKGQLRDLTISEQANPFPFPHADTTIFDHNLYAGDESGIFKAWLDNNKEHSHSVSKKAEQVCDIPAFSISGAYQTLAIAGGSEGLFGYNLEKDFYKKYEEPRPIIKEHSIMARWMFSSVFSSSYYNQGYLANFSFEKQQGAEKLKSLRRLLGTLSSSDIFRHQTEDAKVRFIWGVEDKVCLGTKKGIEIVQFNPLASGDRDERFNSMGLVDTVSLDDEVVKADSALFGYIIETSNGLMIINSQLETIWLEGEPVNWRVFPKSKYYTNQLHVVSDDHLSIYSFNQDYFVNQDEKKVGIKYLGQPPYYQSFTSSKSRVA